MKTAHEQRDELLTLLCDVLQSLAEEAPSFTAQSFVSKARAMQRCGQHERALEYVKIAKSYIAPQKVTV